MQNDEAPGARRDSVSLSDVLPALAVATGGAYLVGRATLAAFYAPFPVSIASLGIDRQQTLEVAALVLGVAGLLTVSFIASDNSNKGGARRWLLGFVVGAPYFSAWAFIASSSAQPVVGLAAFTAAILGLAITSDMVAGWLRSRRRPRWPWLPFACVALVFIGLVGVSFEFGLKAKDRGYFTPAMVGFLRIDRVCVSGVQQNWTPVSPGPWSRLGASSTSLVLYRRGQAYTVPIDAVTVRTVSDRATSCLSP